MRKLCLFLSFLILAAIGNTLLAQCSVSLGPDVSICAGKHTNLTATVTGGPPTSYSWTSIPAGASGTTSTLNVSPAVTTTYIVHIAGNGCNASDTIVVTVNPLPTAPVITASPASACSGSTINFSTSTQAGDTYTWSYGDGTTGSGVPASHIFKSYGTGTVNYTVTATATTAAGCTATATQTVTITQQASATIAQGSGVDTVTLNGVLNFYKCVNNASQSTNFNFVNPNPTAGTTATIIWGDTGTTVSLAGTWTNISHIYGRGPFTITYITNNGDGCPDTTHYIVFFGNNPAGGIASLGSTSICGPDSLLFAINNWQSNAPGTIYTVTFNDGTPTLTFGQPPPDTIAHWFGITSCGTSSSNGTITFNNAFKATLTVQNPCGITAGAVVPIYVSFAPKASYAVTGGDTTCVNSGTTFVNTTLDGQSASNQGCDVNSPILWNVLPATGWSITAGSLGSDNGFTGVNYDPTSWTPGSNTLSLNFANAGSYQVQLISGNSCGIDTFIQTICVTPPPVPSFTLAPTSGCAPFTVNTTNTTPPINTCGSIVYVWSIVQDSFTCNPVSGTQYTYTGGTGPNSTSPSLIFADQGTYSISLIASNACGAVATPAQSVTVKTVPTVAITAPALVCAGTNITPVGTILPCSGTISSYNWSFPGGTPSSSTSQVPGTVDYSGSGSHTISLAVSNECGTTTATAVVVVDTIPVVVVGPPVSVCSGSTVQIGGANVPGLTYVWTPGTGLSSTTVSNPVVTLTNNGTTPVTYTYYLTVTNTLGCKNNDSVKVTVYPPATVNAGPPVSVCGDGASINLNGTFGGSATSVTWTSNNGGTFANANSATTTYTPSITSGTVILTLTTNDPAGPCPAATSTLTVTVIAPPVAVAGNNDSICSGGSAQLGAASQAGYTYLWSPATGLSATNVSNPTATLTNNGTTVISQTYTLIVTANGCKDTASVTVYVFPPATVSAGAPGSVCAGGTITLTGTIGGSATSATWSSPSGTFNPTNALTTIFTPSIPSGFAVVTLTTNVPSTVCPAASASINITVKPIPTVTTNPLHQTICSGASTPGIVLTSGVAGTTYTWTGSSPNGITGFIASGTTNVIPSQTLTDPATTPGIVVYVITPTAAGCPGPPVNDTITVDPLPNVNPIPEQTICSAGTSTAVTPTSTTTGTTFNWIAASSGNLTGFTASGTGTIPAQTITNTGNVIDSVVFTITPTANGCSGTPVNFTVVVDPKPKVNVPAAQTICSGTTSAAVTLTSPVAGATFSWTAAATGGITGFTASGAGNIPAQTLNDPGTTAGTVTYTITATANGCPGTPKNYVITVDPIPTATATPSPDTICNNVQTNIAITSNVAGTTFAWTVNEPGSVTGASAGSGSSIQQTLANSSSAPQTVSYYITPTANGCNGPVDTVNVVVNPTVVIAFSPANQTICSGQTSTLVNITSTTAGAVFSWTSAANGITGVIASGTNTIPAQTLTNSTNASLTAVYTVSASYDGCPGPNAAYDITVNPIPHVILPAFQTICSGTSTTSISLTSNVAGATFSWTGSSPNGITGFTASGTTSNIPGQTLTDPNTAPGIVAYVITPTAAGCAGPAANDTITVNPLPNVTPVAPQTICSAASSTAVTLTSTTAGTTFSWTASTGGSLTGFTASGSGTIPVQTITNSGTTVDSVVYIITPKANGCNGPPVHFDIIVNPVPNVNLPAPQTICSGVTTVAGNLTSNVTGTTFSWTAAATAGITGYTASGTGNIPAQTLSNSANTPGTVTYTITPTANGCPGPTSAYVITVNPVAIVTATPSPDTICTGTQTNIALTSNVAGTTFSWTFTEPGSVTGASNGSGSAIQQVLTNSSATSQTVTYIVTPKAHGCNGIPDTVNVVVGPNVTIVLPANQTICSGQSTTAVSITSPAGGVVFAWTSQANGVTGVTASGSSSIPVQTLINPGSSAITVVYNITATYANCPAQTAAYDITADPTPHVILPAFQTICSGNSTNNINLTSNVAGTTFAWTGSSPNGITGFTISGTTTGIPAQTLTDPNTTPGIVVYVITPTAAGCIGPVANDTITVNPLPNVNTIAQQTVCSGVSSTAVTLSSTTTGTTFSWTASNAGSLTGFTASGAGNIPVQTISNGGTTIDSVVYIITPRANGCNGPPVHFDIIVNPVPNVILPANQTICSGVTSIVANVTSSVAGATFSWTAVANAGITGFTASGTGNIPAQTLSNSANTPGNVTYTVTPSANGCPGPPSNYTITVNPVAIVTATPSPDTICTGTQTNIALSSNVAGTTFSWTFTEPVAITGAANGSGTAIQQVLTNTSAASQTVTYVVTPRAHGCNGLPDTVMVVVGPAVTIVLPANQTICSGQNTQAVAITSPSGGVGFSWTSQANGITGVAASGTDSIPVQTLVNGGNGAVTVVYNITAAYANCASQSATYNITVDPTPHVILPAFQTICSGTSTNNINLTSNVAGATFAWTGSSPNGITGFIASGTTVTIPAQTLTNPNTTTGIVVYVITPTAAGCAGSAVNDTITVNSLPNINALTPQTLCSGATSSAVTLSSTTAGTTFSWTASNGGNLSGYTGGGTGNIPTQTIINSGTTIDSVVYIITPRANGCNGPVVHYDIIVNPVPNVILPLNQTICSGVTSAVANVTSNVAGTSFAWTAVATANITGFTASGTGNISAQTLVNTGNTQGTVTYTVTPTANGCPGPAANYVITVNPVAKVTATPSPDTICTATQTSIALSSNVAGTTFSWTVSAPGSITGAANGTGNNIQQVLTNSSAASQTVTYIVTPKANGCNGLPDTVYVVVGPAVTIQLPANQTICSGQATLAVGITSPAGGVAFSWTSQANGITGVVASGTDSIPVQTLVNPGSAVITVVYNITAAYANCASQSATYNIVVDPTPHVILPAFQTICSGTSTTNINLTSHVAGTTYSWTGSSPDGVTGFIATGTTATIPAQTLTNPAVTPGMVVYVITPTAAGCVGPAVYDTITVNPLPNVNPLTPQTLCSGVSSTAVTLSSTTTGTTFTWTASTGGNLSGFSTSGSGNIPVQTITNSGNTIDSVVYVITPDANGCNGPAVHYDIIADPVPAVILPAPQSICSGTSTVVANLASNVAGTTFSWTAVATGGITGFSASGSGNIPSQTLTNPGSTAGTVTYTITPTANGCPGPNSNYVVTVKPIPVVSATPAIDTICPSAQTTISLTSTVAGTTFAWTVTAPPSITGEANGAGNAIQQVLANSSVNPQTVTYVITPTASACPGLPETVTVVVLPGVNIQFSATNQTICTGQSTVAVAITSASPNVIFSWTSIANGIIGVTPSGTDSIPVQVLLNNGNAGLTANYNVVAGYTGCPSQTATYSITVNPAPHVILPPAQTICSGTSTTAIAIGSNVAGTNFSWTGSSPDGVTGFIASGNTNSIPAQVLTNAASTVGMVIYAITPNAAGCPGLFVFDTITVNPLPDVNPLTPQTICSGGTSTPVNLSSTTAGTTFAWTATSASLSGYNTSGTGNIPAQTITNSGTNIDSVVFTITPTANGCNGPNVKYTITADPTPHVILPAAQSICSNTSTVVATLTSGVAGTTYSWSATGSAGITGFTASGTGNIPVQTLTNPGNVSGTVTYTITPTANGCPGPPSNYVVTVKPLPVITATPGVDTICPSTQTNISLSSSVAATTFNWTFNEPASVTGAAAGTGNSIQQTLNNTSQNPQTVLYIITPTAAGCNGPPDTVYIVVHPGVAINFSLPNQTICSGQTIQAVAITSPSPGVTFAWTSQANGVTGVAASGTDSIPAQTLVNSGTVPLTVNYNATAGYPGCPLQVGTYSVLVNPTPAVILPPAQTICSGTSTQSIAIASNVAGTTFTWTGSSPDGVTGFTASGNTSVIPVQALTNSSAAPGYVIFAITPGASGCPGAAVYDTVTVNPLPVVNPLSTQTICSETSSNAVTLSSATAGTTYTWTASGAGLTGFTASGSGNIPAQTITNAGTTIDSVVFTIVPKASGCNGPASTFTIVVDPLPNVNLPAGQIICSNQTDTAVVLTSNVAGTTFAWTASAGPNITGFATSGTGNIPAQVISNSGNVSGILTYSITPTANGCPGPDATYNITIKPLPVISAMPAPDTICPSTQTNITLSSTIPGTAITWVVNEPAAITGATGGSGNIIQQVLSNSSSNPQTVLYIISSSVNGCNGLPDTVDVLVHPGVALQLSAGPQTICSGQSTLPVVITSASPGVTFSWTSQANGVGGVAASGTDTIPAQTLTNTGNFGLTVDYYISAGYPGCPITTTTYGIAVNPAPSAILPPFQTICSGTPSQVISITSNVPGTGFTWSGVSPDGVTGYPVSGNSSAIPSQVLTNASDSNEIVVYTITPSSSGCPGVTVHDTITVKPLPVINPLTGQTLCSGSTSTAVTPTSNTPGTTFAWSVIYSGNISGFTNSGTGTIPVQTLSNNGTAIDSVVFMITPAANGCNGPAVNYSIVVNPVPDVILPASQDICSGTSTNVAVLTSYVAGTTYAWSANGTAGVTGFTTSGTGNIPAQTLTYYGVTSGSVTYVVTPSANNCVGPPSNYVVVVKPVPVVSATPVLDTICPSTQTNIAITANVTGTTFSWTVVEPASVTGASAGAGNSILQILSNSSQTMQTVLYIITPDANGCVGLPDTVTLVVRPEVAIQFSLANQTICSGQNTQAVAITSTSPNVVFSWTSQANGVTGVVASGTDSIPVQTLLNPTTGVLAVTYNVTAGYGGCPPVPASYDIVVNPNPAVILPPSQTICSGTASQSITIGSTVSGTTFAWTGVSPNGISGFTPSGTANVILSEVLTNPASTQGFVVYSVTPSSTGCPGVAVNDTIFVNPAPVIGPLTPQTICSGATSTVVNISSTTAGTTFSWNVAHSGDLTGYTGNGNGNIPAQTITNNGFTIDSIVFTITPMANGCNGPPVNNDIIVDPLPNVILPASQTICSGTNTIVVPVTGNVAGTTFSWTATGTAGITGFTASGTGNIPVQTITNANSVAGSVTYTITPLANGCPGPPSNYVVTVNPTPIANATPSPDTICPSAQTSISITSTVAGTSFSWTATGPPAITGESNGTGSSIVQVLANSSQSPQTVVYIITPEANGCVGPTDTALVVVNSGIAILFSPGPQIICSGQSTQAVQITSTSPGVTFSWTPQSNGVSGVAASGTDVIPVQTLVNNSVFAATVDYNVTASYPGCPGYTATYSIVVNPNPSVILPPSQTICNGTASQTISISSTVSGTTFTWTGSSPNGVTGFTASGNSAVIPSTVLANTASTQGYVVYSVTPSSTGCPGVAETDTIFVNPSPIIDPLTPQTICSAGTSTPVNITSATVGTTFNWNVTHSGNLTGYIGNGSGNIPAQTITNNGFTIDSVVFTITPTASGCNGPAVNYDIVVDPTPNVVLPTSQTICSGASTVVATLTSNVSGTTFSWTAASANGITGFTASGTGDIPVQTLTNPNNVAGSVTYTITPTANGCPGAPVNYTVTVNPTPIASATPSPDTICPSAQTSISITSTVANTTFSWTATGPGSISGESNGTGSSIQQVLSNNSQSPQTVVYVITPEANGCFGPTDTALVVVNPGVSIQFAPGPQTICSGQSTQSVQITSTSPNVNFVWTSQANGVTGVAPSGTDSIPVQTLVNNSVFAATVDYNVTASYPGCPGYTATYSIVVNPNPSVILPPSQTICNGTASQTISISSTVSGTTFTWTGSSPNGVTGFTASGNSAVIPSTVLANTASTQGYVVYSVTPSSTGCPGVALNDTIFVNPSPIIDPLTPQTICSAGTSTPVNITSATVGTAFNWNVTHSGNLTGYTGNGSGNIPAQTITNNGFTIDSVVFTITPTASGCNGPAVNYDIVVDPTPNVVLPTSQTICSGASTVVATLTSNVTGTTFSWTAASANGITGFTANGTGDIPVQTLTNPNNVAGSVTYTITPTANGCPGAPVNYTVTVNPTPIASATPSPDTICPSAQTSISITSTVANTTFSWTATGPASISGESNGTGSSIQQVLSNNSQSPQTVVYVITPEANGCFGPTDTALVVVNPGVSIQFAPGPQTICSGQSTQSVQITSTSPNVNFVWTSQANGVTGVAPSGTDSIPVQTLVNTGSFAATVDYTVTASYASCPGYTATYSIVVNPKPAVILPPFQTVCSGAASQPISNSSNVNGTTFSWTGSSPDGITGFTAGGTGSVIPSQVLTNGSAQPGYVVFAVTPSSTGCPGAAVNDTLTVNPLPVIAPLTPQTICSATTSLPVNITSATAGTIFSWNVFYSGNLSGFTGNGAGNIPAQTITNNGSTIDSVVYTITPTASGCNGPSVNYDIIVDPSPNVILPGPQSICSGASTSVVVLNSSVLGATYSWTATGGADITGFTATGTGNIPAQVINNSGNTPSTVNYVINATANGCTGPPNNYVVTIKPLPVASATPSPDTICNGTQTNIALTSTVTGTTFSWIVSAAAGITGAANGNGNSIQQILTDTTAFTTTATYIITPVAGGCVGPDDTLNVVVNPVANILFTPVPQIICSGQSTQAVAITSLTPGATFTWTSQANGVTGVSASGTNTIAVQTLVNNSNAIETVVYTVVSNYFNCPGTTATYTIVVNPTPQVILPPAQTVCAGVGSAPVTLSSAVGNTTFAWTASSPGLITGFIPSGTTSVIPSQTFANPADTAGTVVYVITPTANTCSGPPVNYIITVNPIPDVILPAEQTICSGGSTIVATLTSDVAGTTYTWTSTAGVSISGNTASGTGNIPVQTLTNSGTQIDSVTYVIVPSASGCPGPAGGYSVLVNPVPVVVFAPGPQTLCSGQTSQPVIITSPTTGVNITWTAAVPNGITGADSTGQNIIPAQTLANTLVDTFPRPLQVVYTAQAFTTGTVCPGTPANYVITVEPVPSISFIQNLTNGCSPLTVGFFPTTLNYGIPDTLVFNWGDGSANTVVYPSGVSPQWYPVNHTFNNDSASPRTFVITLTAHNDCIDTMVTRTVTVLPNQISAFFTATPTSGCAPLTVTLHDQSTGPGLLSWCFDFNVQRDSCMGVGEIDSAGATISYTFPAGSHTVALYITNGFGCAHDSAFQTILVSPAPVADFVFAEDSCSRTPVVFTNQSTLPPGTTVAENYWQFGNGDTSLLVNPVYTYDTSGVYNACLTVTANTGCSNTICKPVPVFYKPIVSFTNFDTCLNKQPIIFVNTSLGAVDFIWNFGDGNTSVTPNPGHTFAGDGTYQVTLIGNNSVCSDTVTQPVVIYPDPLSAFSISPTSVCGAPATLQMTSQSVGAQGFNWNFGNGATSTNVNPAVTYTSVGRYTVCLAVANALGCTDTMCHPDTLIVKPLVNFVNFDTCLNTQPIMFRNNSINANQYFWNFGDGNTSVLPNPSHSYSAPGTYNVTLIGILNTCSDTFNFPAIIYPVPIAAFTVPGPYTCGVPANLQMVNNSIGALGYSWNFGNGTTSGDINPVATYAAQGSYVITLAATNIHGCVDSAANSALIYAYPGIQSVTVTPSEGCQPVDAQFVVLATNANSFTWNFGDGSTVTTTSPVISHLYTDTGVYSASVDVYNYGSCGDTLLLPDTVTVHINPTASFDYSMSEVIDSAIGTVQFVNTSLNATSYVWQFGDGDSSSLVNPAHMYPDINNFDVVLIASTPYGCKDTAMKSIFVIKKSLYVPNAFAPEFNAGNDLVQVWKPAGMGLLDYHAQIFNKWGELLWESSAITNDDMKSPAEGWDGRYQGKLCQQGVYVWKIDAVFIDGTRWDGMKYKFQIRKKTIGDVTLIR